MNTSALKAFAPAVRRALMEAVDRKLDVVLAAQSPDYLTTYATQVEALQALARADRDGLIERVAYSWFNRLAALRYLDARGWHPFRARVLTATGDDTQPELLRQMRAGALPTELARHTDPARLNDLLDGRIPSTDPQGEVYRYLVLAACRFYHALLPDLFERLDDATELLLTDDLLTEHSVVQGFRTEISDEDCADVEILGWLYQFYISERKDEVMARKSAVPTEDIPAVTQLFTPHWIVRYLVENSLGRLWLLNRPGSRLREQMPYYIEGEAETDFLRVNTPEEIRLCDPAVGSGHMLTYAFDLLYAIYEEEGYAAAEIPGLILRHNLVGLDIDARAAQLASLALVLKARERNPRFFEAGQLTPPQIIELQDVHFSQNELRDYSQAAELGSLLNEPMLRLLHQFEEAKTFGSLIQPCLSEPAILLARRAIEAKEVGDQLSLHETETHRKILRVLEQAKALTQRYHVVVANPPYIDLGAMNAVLKTFVEAAYEPTKQNTDASFIQASRRLALKNGFIALITQRSWMFLSRLEDFRSEFLANDCLANMLYLGPRTFPEINGEKVQNTAFVSRTGGGNSVSSFYRLDKLGSADKETAFLKREHCYRRNVAELKDISGFPIAFWASAKLVATFKNRTPLKETADIRVGLDTGDNPRFLRLWWEASIGQIEFGAKDSDDFHRLKRKWAPHTKGGEFRKWFGNLAEIIAYSIQDYQVLSQQGNRLPSRDFYFRPGMTYTRVSTDGFSVRTAPMGCVFNSAAPTVFPTGDTGDLIFGILNSSVVDAILECLSPTLNYQAGELRKIPIPHDPNLQAAVSPIVHSSVALARADWDNFETSWDFHDQPLLRPGLKSATLEASWRNWEAQCTVAISRMQELETGNNRLFINAYGLQGELEPDVPEEQITLARADARKDMAAFLSYAAGCMMGRYSPDHPGLILANAGDTLEEYLAKAGRPQDQLTFAPDEDGVIPVLEGEWFEDDIVARTRDFVRATFGEATLRENVRFIEESLGKDLRKYFLTDFYKDHLQTYKKRPIYWMVQSPKKGFAVLIYLHRYTRDTLNVVLNRYLREYQGKLRNRLAHLKRTPTEELSARDRTTARKETERLTKVLHECEQWERQTLLPLAQQRIALDLDDGVKVNYLKLSEALAPIPGLAAADE